MIEQFKAPPNTASASAVVPKFAPDRLTLNQNDWLLLGGIVIAVILASFVAGSLTLDDAYITFRNSRNIIEGLGIVYIPMVYFGSGLQVYQPQPSP